MIAGVARSAASRVVLVAVLLALGAPVASAHLGHVILRAERYLKLDASEADTRLVVSLTLGATEGARVLAAADADSSGEVSSAEADAYLAQWAEGLRTDLPVRIDGAPAEVSWRDGYLDPIGPVQRTALTVEIVGHLPVQGREHRIHVHDGMRREVFDRTDVAFRAHDGAELVVSGPGLEPAELVEDLAFGRLEGAEAPADLSAVVRYPGRSAVPAWAVPAAGGAIVLGAAAALLARARRKRG